MRSLLMFNSYAYSTGHFQNLVLINVGEPQTRRHLYSVVLVLH